MQEMRLMLFAEPPVRRTQAYEEPCVAYADIRDDLPSWDVWDDYVAGFLRLEGKEQD